MYTGAPYGALAQLNTCGILELGSFATWPDTEGIQLGDFITRPETKGFQLFTNILLFFNWVPSAPGRGQSPQLT
jgi:hypothetical protein